jgi:hypothetical protein
MGGKTYVSLFAPTGPESAFFSSNRSLCASRHRLCMVYVPYLLTTSLLEELDPDLSVLELWEEGE